MNFAKNLKKLRQDNNLSQEDIAEKLNTSFKTISHWETGYSEPSLTQLEKLSKIFDVTIDELIKD